MLFKETQFKYKGTNRWNIHGKKNTDQVIIKRKKTGVAIYYQKKSRLQDKK